MHAGASATQEFHANGSVTVMFDAVLQCATAGESGMLRAHAGGQAPQPWHGAAACTCNSHGEQICSVQASLA